jgi:hypothetical protein
VDSQSARNSRRKGITAGDGVLVLRLQVAVCSLRCRTALSPVGRRLIEEYWDSNVHRMLSDSWLSAVTKHRQTPQTVNDPNDIDGIKVVDSVGNAIFVPLGPAEYLDLFLAEYELDVATVEGLIESRKIRSVPIHPSDLVTEKIEYSVHVSLLRSHGEFPCAGDNDALTFCREIVDEMVRLFEISNDEAVARVNRQWSEPEEGQVAPQTWIVGLDIIYHEEPDRWAKFIYYGGEGRWWDPASGVQPLPPPD